MNLHIFNIILGVVSALGVTGAIVALFVAPAVAEPIIGAFMRLAGKILGTRVGLGLTVGILCLIVGELYGTHQANITCRANTLALEHQADVAATKRDLVQAVATDTDAQGRVTELEALNKANEEKINAYIAELASRKSAVCLLDSRDIQRLR